MPTAKSRAIQYKKGPVRISAPSSSYNSRSSSSASSEDDNEDFSNTKTGEKRTSSHSGSHRPSSRRRVDDDVEMRETQEEPKSFIDKVRLSKEKKLNANKSRASTAVAFSAPSSSTSSERTKLSMSDYRASRGLPPAAPSRGVPPPRQPSSTGSSSLFINRKRPVASVSTDRDCSLIKYILNALNFSVLKLQMPCPMELVLKIVQ